MRSGFRGLIFAFSIALTGCGDEGSNDVGTVGADASDETDATDGSDGTDATDGSDGTDATDGSDGSDATDGSDGSDATDGSDGSDATDGSDGSDATDGSDGTDGTPVCTEGSPLCSPGCEGGFNCVYLDGECSCEPTCDASAPKCGPGENDGCPSGKICDATCACVDKGCFPEAPECPGGCTAGNVCGAECTCVPEQVIPAAILLRPSRSSSVDIDREDKTVAMVNSDDGSVSFFDVGVTGAETLRGKAETSEGGNAEPLAVVIHPDGKTAFVANRDGSIAKISDIDTASPALSAGTSVNGEAVGVALSPTGATVYVTDWVAGELRAFSSDTLAPIATVKVGTNPYALAVTNDGDTDDTDEKILITEFYGRPEGKEMLDDGRKGIVYVVDTATHTLKGEIPLAPLTSCFTGDLSGSDVTTGCFPNQLLGITIHTAFGVTRAYVVSVGAAPKGPVAFNHNMQAVVSVIDVATEKEEPALTVNLNQLIKDQQPDSDGDDSKGRRFINMPMGIGFVGNPDIAVGYLAASGSDIVLRVAWDEAGAVTVGSTFNFNIPVGQSPQGIVTKNSKTVAKAYVGNLISRDLSVVSFADQATSATLESTKTPEEALGTQAEIDIWKGKRFFNTGTGIWAKESWGSCQGCHFMGLADSVTWAFAAGPRQTISLDGQYDSKNPADMRALNWTAIFDETHDFENNTRGTSGGKGAIQKPDGTPVASPAGAPATFAQITAEDGATVENHQALNGSMTHLTRTSAICGNTKTCPDWDQVDAYIRTVKSPRGLAGDDVAAGRAIFEDGGCAKCHSGPKWTTSSTFYRPAVFTGALPSRVFEAARAAATPKDGTKLATLPAGTNKDANLIAGDDSTGTPALKRIACNLRDVGTFAADGGAPETRANGTEAQGKNGFNPPSLLGLVLGAPYFHNGAAETLADVFDAARFAAHLKAGNPNFTLSESERDSLIAFLLSIDESTTPFPIPADVKLCPENFTP